MSPMAAATLELARLDDEHRESLRGAKWQEFLGVAEVAKAEAVQLSGAVVTLRSHMVKHDETLRRLGRLSAESGGPSTWWRIAPQRRSLEISNAPQHGGPDEN